MKKIDFPSKLNPDQAKKLLPKVNEIYAALKKVKDDHAKIGWDKLSVDGLWKSPEDAREHAEKAVESLLRAIKELKESATELETTFAKEKDKAKYLDGVKNAAGAFSIAIDDGITEFTVEVAQKLTERKELEEIRKVQERRNLVKQAGGPAKLKAKTMIAQLTDIDLKLRQCFPPENSLDYDVAKHNKEFLVELKPFLDDFANVGSDSDLKTFADLTKLVPYWKDIPKHCGSMKQPELIAYLIQIPQLIKLTKTSLAKV